MITVPTQSETDCTGVTVSYTGTNIDVAPTFTLDGDTINRMSDADFAAVIAAFDASVEGYATEGSIHRAVRFTYEGSNSASTTVRAS